MATDATASTAWPPPERHAITNSAGGISLEIGKHRKLAGSDRLIDMGNTWNPPAPRSPK